MTIPKEHKSYFEEEWYHVRHSGEIPEIAYHSSIYFLTEDKDGPEITLTEDGLKFLQQAATARYLEIILRDITPENRDATIYRGALRTICNWRRFKRFCERNGMETLTVKQEVSSKFLSFLENEVKEVKAGIRRSSINCTWEDIVSISVELGFCIDHLANDLEHLCRNV